MKDITNTRLIHTCILNYIVLPHLLACFRIVDTCTHTIKHAAYTYTTYTHGSIQAYAQTLIRTHSIHKNAIHPRQHMRIQAYQHTRLHAYLHTCMTCMCWYMLWSGTTKRDCLPFFFFFTYIRHTWSGQNTDPVASHMYGLNGAYLETIVLTWSAVVALINLQPSSFRSVDHSCRDPSPLSPTLVALGPCFGDHLGRYTHINIHIRTYINANLGEIHESAISIIDNCTAHRTTRCCVLVFHSRIYIHDMQTCIHSYIAYLA